MCPGNTVKLLKVQTCIVTDPCVCVTTLAFFHANGRGHELPETLDFVYSVLDNRAYDNGTVYYIGGDPFLFFFSRFSEYLVLITEGADPSEFGDSGDTMYHSKMDL